MNSKILSRIIGTIGFIAIIALFPAKNSIALAASCSDDSTTTYACVCTTGSFQSPVDNTKKTEKDCNDLCYNSYKEGGYKLTCTEVIISDGSAMSNTVEMAQGNVSAALTDAPVSNVKSFITPTLNVPIPGFTEFTKPTVSGKYISVNFIGEYIAAVYNYLLGAAALVAVVMMMVGGLQYIMSRGKEKYITKAKTRITNAITGIILLLLIYNIAFFIDPNTLGLKGLNITNVDSIAGDIAAQGGEEESDAITPNDFSIKVVPITDFSANHIAYTGSQADGFVDEEAATALKAAGAAFYTASGGKNITVTDATRSLKTQAEDFYKNCLQKGGICSPVTCNPTGSNETVVKKSGGKYVLTGAYATETNASTIIAALSNPSYAKLSNCAHTSGVAIDAWGGERGTGNFANDVTLQQQLITAMIGAGFCRLSLEVWHFELESKKVSKKSCSSSWSTTSYIRKDTKATESPTADCQKWNFREYRCETKKG